MQRGQCEECGTRLYQAGEQVPAGEYMRVDDGSFQCLRLDAGDVLPASFDGHVAQYRIAAAPCACELRQASATGHDASGVPTDQWVQPNVAADAAPVESGQRDAIHQEAGQLR